jgi:putative nucleotidyltransferase with HDIG domain
VDVAHDKQKALALLREYTKNENLVKHGLAVAAAMRHYAEKYGQDADKWEVVGILHDFDYEIHPTLDEHPQAGEPILRQHGYPDDVIYAIMAHGTHLGLPFKSQMDKTLWAVDELAGFVTAAALVRPGRSIMGLEAASVRKKMKDKAFARAVRREDITGGAELLGLPLDEHIGNVIAGMQRIAGDLGLAGEGA